MAYVKRHAIKVTLNNSIRYILDSEKTDGDILISSNSCSNDARIAYLLMKKTKEKFDKNDGILGFHFIQSFKPGEIDDAKVAHEIGESWAEKFLDKHEYVLATHVDKGHVHNHIIINSVSFVDGKKYNSNKKELENIREFSDNIVQEYGLSVIPKKEDGNHKKYTGYKEYNEKKNGTSWKEIIKHDIDETIKVSKTFDEFKRKLKDQGYEIKDEPHLKYISFKKIGMGRAIRGREGSLGRYYTKEMIRERIETNVMREAIKNLSLKDDVLSLRNQAYIYMRGGHASYYNSYNNDELKQKKREDFNRRKAMDIAQKYSIDSFGRLIEEIKNYKEKVESAKSMYNSLLKKMERLKEEYQPADGKKRTEHQDLDELKQELRILNKNMDMLLIEYKKHVDVTDDLVYLKFYLEKNILSKNHYKSRNER